MVDTAASGAASVDAVDTWRELIFGVVRPVGIDRESFVASLTQALQEYDYRVHHVQLSALLSETYMRDAPDPSTMTESERIRTLIDGGDRLCELAETASAVALCGVLEIHERRKQRQEGDASERVAYIVDSIKRVEEVTQLQSIYGNHYIQFGLQAAEENRAQLLQTQERAATFDKSESDIAAAVAHLIGRDLREADEYGQNTMRAFPMSDVFIDTDRDTARQLGRVLNLLFGSPVYSVPTAEEYGMELAYLSSTRSPELGLKVGAAIMTEDQRVVSMGVNVHPEDKEQSPVFDESASEIGRLVLDTMQALGPEYLNSDAVAKLQNSPDQFTRALIQGPLKSAKIKDLTEFQPTVHAEMSALLDAMRDRSSLDGVTMYVTAFPCHGCAKHIVDLKLPIVYLEPYPKSRAAAMYGNTVGRTFRVFSGIAPWRYQEFFHVGTNDRKSPDGTRRVWTQQEKHAASPKVSNDITIELVREREAVAIGRLPDPNDFVSLRGSEFTDVVQPGNTDHNKDGRVPSTGTTGGENSDV